MAFARPTLEELRARIQGDFQERANGGNAYIRRAFENVLSWVIAGVTHGLHGHMAANARFLPTDCDEEQLGEWAEMYELPRKDPTKARRQATFVGSNGSTLTAGTNVQRNDGVKYVVLANGVVALGTVTVTVEALVAGTAANTDGPSPIVLASPVPGISTDGAFEVLGGIDGTDVEDLEVWRERVLLRVRNPVRGGITTDYEIWARATEGVTIRDVFVRPHRSGIGSVDLAFTVEDANPIPSPGQVALVQAKVDSLRPADMASCLVYAPTGQTQNYTIAIWPFNDAVKTAITTQLDDLHAREALMGETLLLSHINESISAAEGEYDHLMTVPSANVVPATSDHLILRGAFSWSALPEP